SVQYVYRLITDNGQISRNSPLSDVYWILKESQALKYAGGDVSEPTNKRVTIICDIPNYSNYSKIECIALEYEANGIPSSIKSLGIKDLTSSSIQFEHNGSESEFNESFTIEELTNTTATWKYCSA